MEFDVDALATELYTLDAEAEALFGGGFTFKFDLATCAYDALPGESVERGATQKFGYGSMVERIACGGGDFAVGRDLSPGDRADDAAERGVARLVFSECVFQDSSLETLGRSGTAHEQNFIRGDSRVARMI
jgi:hypothetical protein